LFKNTAVAEAIFDGITYAKRCCSIEAISFLLMGDDKFSAALKKLFYKICI
jgi:hypothetical protein